jgi:nitroreductase
MNKQILDALNWRFATKVFDPSKKVSEENLHTILEAGRLAPSSFGIEAWKFLVVENPEVRGKIRDAGYGQTQIADASHLIVIARRTDVRERITDELVERSAKTMQIEPEKLDGLKQMLQGSIMGRSDADLDAWIRSQAYIALGMMMETASLLNIDNAALEGFNPATVDEILGLGDKRLASTCLLVVGYRMEDSATQTRPKVRRGFEEVVEFIK